MELFDRLRTDLQYFAGLIETLSVYIHGELDEDYDTNKASYIEATASVANDLIYVLHNLKEIKKDEPKEQVSKVGKVKTFSDEILDEFMMRKVKMDLKKKFGELGKQNKEEMEKYWMTLREDDKYMEAMGIVICSL